MVKLFKNALSQVVGEARRKPSLIELQTFVSDALRIVNDRPFTTVSSHPHDLNPISPSSFLGHQLAPNTPVSAFHERGDLRREYVYNTTLAQSSGKPGSKVTSRPYRDEKSVVLLAKI